MEEKRTAADAKVRFWKAHFATWEKSGLSQREYCRRCNLKLSTFTWWRRRLRMNAQVLPALVPVPLANESAPVDKHRPATTGLSLVVGDRCRIEIGAGFHAGTFARLISVLEDM